MISLANEPNPALAQRLEACARWAMGLYGSPMTRRLRFRVALPEPCEYQSKPVMGSNNSSVVRSYTPAVQRHGSEIWIHPSLCKSTVPRYVLRFVVVMSMIFYTQPGPQLLKIKRRQAPYVGQAPAWLERKGFAEDRWDLKCE